MKLKSLFTITALVSLLFGVGLLAAPAILVGTLTGQQPDALGVHISREAGALVLAVSVISWMARNAERSNSTNAIVVGLSIAFPLLAILSAVSTWNGTLAPTYWVNFILFSILALGFWVVGRPSFRS